MKQNLLYKILSIILFIIIVGISLLLYNKIHLEVTKSGVYIGVIVLLSGIITSLFFLLDSKKQSFIFSEKFGLKKDKDESDIEEKIDDKKVEAVKMAKIKSAIILKNLDGKKNVNEITEQLLMNCSELFSIVQGIAFVKNKNNYTKSSSYALYLNREISDFEIGEGITGQVAKDKKLLKISEIPEGYITVLSGLGNSNPTNLLVIPFVYNDTTVAVFELAAFVKFPDYIDDLYSEISSVVGEKINALLN